MALKPVNPQHALQILAGIEGRKKGHQFEIDLTNNINNIKKAIVKVDNKSNLIYGEVEIPLINKALHILEWNKCDSVEAIALGALATQEDGKKWLKVQGVEVKACKSDILLTLHKDNLIESIGVSVKQSNKNTPTNAQLYFTTATAFFNLLNQNNIQVTSKALNALKQFCGDIGHRPIDLEKNIEIREIHPGRYFWEEINLIGRLELERIFTEEQDKITKLLLQKAYLNDPFVPEILLHKTKKMSDGEKQEFAIYTIDELICLSKEYACFNKKKYRVRKGSHKDPIGIEHDAPRFGIVQMQRGGQKQHPTQLQFNLQAGYFYHI